MTRLRAAPSFSLSSCLSLSWAQSSRQLLFDYGDIGTATLYALIFVSAYQNELSVSPQMMTEWQFIISFEQYGPSDCVKCGSITGV